MENAESQQCYAFQEFFKAFRQDTNSTHLRLPKAFNKFFKGVTPCKTILIDQGANCWDVCLEKIEDHLIFTKGWQQFAIEKHLEERDLLVFKYDGNSAFYVKVFSKTGCRKEALHCGEIVPLVNLDKASDQSCGKSKRGRKRKHSPTTLKTNEKLDSNGPSEGSRSKLKRVCKEEVIHYEEKESGLREPKSEENPPASLANCAPLKYPGFEIYFSPSRLNHVELTKRVLAKWNIKLGSKLKLRDENGKLWPVAIREMANRNSRIKRCYLGDGWRNFLRSHNIKVGYTCDFQFVTNKANVAEELLVRVHPPSKCS